MSDGFVIDTVVKADKDADVDRKIHIYSVIGAFAKAACLMDAMQ
jgi:hypothetical protein